MCRCRWDELPNSVRRAVENRCGRVIRFDPAGAGVNSNIATTLYLDDAKVWIIEVSGQPFPRNQPLRYCLTSFQGMALLHTATGQA